jgi:hypothetical protein
LISFNRDSATSNSTWLDGERLFAPVVVDEVEPG